MSYRYLSQWKAWTLFYARLTFHADDYTDEEMERAIDGCCREIDIDRFQFEEWATEQELGRLALKV